MTASTATIGIIGAGAIGLSIAYQLAKTGSSQSIIILDARKPGAASWAGAGILPPPITQASRDPLESLQQLSLSNMPQWSRELLEQTGIDNEYRNCGGYYIALTSGEQAALSGLQQFWKEAGIENQQLDRASWQRREPWLQSQLDWERCRTILDIPTESQVRNPRHLQALKIAVRQLGVVIHDISLQEADALTFDSTTGEIHSGEERRWKCDQWIVAAGTWTSALLERWFGPVSKVAAVYPVKGEMLLFKTPAPLFRSVVNVGTRYFVPRLDGHVLVGSTEQEVGFDAVPSEWGKSQLGDFVQSVLPELAAYPLVGHWAGLRPASYDQTPVIGPLSQASNVFVATGHFRSGLQWSIGTAICLAALVRGETPPIDMRYFQPQR